MMPADRLEAGSNEEQRERITDGSAVLAVGREVGDSVGTAVRNSFLYRWLTTEPDPEIIVIDLRETYIVGPIIGLLDRLVEWVAPSWHTSTSRRVLDEVVDVGERAGKTRTGQLLGKLLAPPPPPESEQRAKTGETPNPSADDTPSEQADKESSR